MTTLFRIVLILVSAGTFAAIMQKIRHSRMQIEDAVFWVLLCVLFVLFALFPPLADTLAHLLGIYSTANFLFLLMIFILVIKVFSLSMHISVLEAKLRELVQEEALSALAAEEADGSLRQEERRISEEIAAEIEIRRRKEEKSDCARVSCAKRKEGQTETEFPKREDEHGTDRES